MNQVTETVLPEWKPARRCNMKKLERMLWEKLEEERGNEPSLRQLYEGLPQVTQDSASITTVLFALLNVANEKGVLVTSTSSLSNPLEDCMVQVLPVAPITPHPALE
jgi:hypothetical protein